MAARFQAARVLTAESGGVFVSTDDGEYANLKMLLDEAWGQANFVADVIWNSRKSVSSDTLISLATNHTTFFAASIASLNANRRSFRLPQDTAKFQNRNNDPKGPWKLDPMDAPNVRKNLTYAIVNPATGQEYYPPSGRCWRFEQHITESHLANGRIVFGRKGTSRPQYKRYLREAVERGLTPTTLWADVRTTTDATKQGSSPVVVGGAQLKSKHKADCRALAMAGWGKHGSRKRAGSMWKAEPRDPGGGRAADATR